MSGVRAPWRIVPARPEDAGELTALARASKAMWHYPDAWMLRWLPLLSFSAAYLRTHWVRVAREQSGAGPAIGVIALEHDAHSAQIAHLWVAPRASGRGVGRALVTAALEEARARGCSEARVESDPNAAPFYERLGARRIGEVPAPMPGSPERTLPLLSFALRRARNDGDSPRDE